MCRTDRVYLTTSLEAAEMYAVGRSRLGVVYLATPLGELEPDPDCEVAGLSFAVASARVVAVRQLSGSRRNRVMRALGLR